MSIELITFEKPIAVDEAIANLPDMGQALGWGVQSMVKSTVDTMIRLASGLTDHFRYALALTDDIAQYLYDMPEGAVTASEHFIRCNQGDGTVIGHFNAMDVHVIQEKSDPEQQAMMLLVLDDQQQVVGYLLTRIREYGDHIAVNNVLPKN